jgi:hypothetical protein
MLRHVIEEKTTGVEFGEYPNWSLMSAALDKLASEARSLGHEVRDTSDDYTRKVVVNSTEYVGRLK